MTAKGGPPGPATNATSPGLRVRIRWDQFDKAAEKLGAMNDSDKARLIGVNRSTMWRYRYGLMSPSLGRAMEIANTLRIKLLRLIEAEEVR